MATPPQNRLFFPRSKETTSDHPRSAGRLCADQEGRQDRSVRPLSGWGDYHEYTRYSPSILLVGDNLARLTQLEGWLESKGCQVVGLNINSNMLASASLQYFDLMIVDLDSFEGADPSETLFAVIQKLKAYPQLSNLPLIILTNCSNRAALTSSLAGPVYCLGKGPSTEAILLQIVAQIHYLTYRYL